MRITFQHNSRAVVAAFLRAPAVMTREVDQAVQRGALEVEREERRRAPKAFSHLAQSVHHRRRAPMDFEVIAGQNYSLAVERGTGPGGSPPRQSIEDWIRVKGIVPRVAATTRGLAFLIGRSIHRKGTPAQPFAEPALRSMTPRVLQLMRQGVDRGVRAVEGR